MLRRGKGRDAAQPAPHRAFALRGLLPVQRLNARENAAGSEKPKRYAVSFTLTLRPLR